MTVENEAILAVDCGSTNLKVAVFDRELLCLGSASVPVSYAVEDGTRFEMPADELKERFLAVSEEACVRAGVKFRAITAVSFASQAQTFAILDSEGVAKTPFYSWMDKRAVAESEELQRALGLSFHEHCSFSACIPQLQAAKILWVQRHLPNGIRPADQVVSLPGFFALALGAENCIDRNLAAMSGLFSMKTGAWWPEALALCGLRPRQLGALVAVGGEMRRFASAKALFPQPLRFVFAGNDQTAGAHGNNCGPGDMVVTLGTALVAYRFVGDKPGPYHSDGCWGPYPGGGYYELATRDEGCSALDWAAKQMPGKPGPEEVDLLALKLKEKGISRNCVFFFPEKIYTDRAWSAAASPDEQAYAVLEGIGFSLKELVEDGLGAGKEITRITVVGGGAASPVWMQMIADILEREIVRGRGDTLVGAAAVATGRNRKMTAGRNDVWTPDAGQRDTLRERYERWKHMRTS